MKEFIENEGKEFCKIPLLLLAKEFLGRNSFCATSLIMWKMCPFGDKNFFSEKIFFEWRGTAIM